MIKRLLQPLVCGLVLLLVFSYGTSAWGNESFAGVLTQVKGKPSGEREEAYMQLKLDSAGWQRGQVLSKDPFAVVTAGLSEEEDAKIRIWTGKLSRVNNDLITTWDEVWIGPGQTVSFAITDMDHAVPGYFAAATQGVFRGVDYAGVYPWISVPTDPEAIRMKEEAVPAHGEVNWYEVPADEDSDTVEAAAIDSLQVVPEQLREKRKFAELKLEREPKDIGSHWSRESVMALMRQGVITGYADGTVQPDKTLSRAEFVTLLLKSLQLNGETGDVSSYPDMKRHWAKTSAGTAERLGILPKSSGNQNWRPQEAVTRMEMVRWIAQALPLINRTGEGETVNFGDTSALDDAARDAIRKAVNNGIVSGYPDGRFHPERKLTRAEAFVVAQRLTEL